MCVSLHKASLPRSCFGLTLDHSTPHKTGSLVLRHARKFESTSYRVISAVTSSVLYCGPTEFKESLYDHHHSEHDLRTHNIDGFADVVQSIFGLFLCDRHSLILPWWQLFLDRRRALNLHHHTFATLVQNCKVPALCPMSMPST